MKLSKTTTRTALSLLALLIICVSIYAFHRAPEVKYLQSGVADSKYETAKVLKIVDEQLEQSPDQLNLRTGTQQLEVKILSGEHKGEVRSVTNYVSLYNHNIFKAGSTAVVNVDTASTKEYEVFVYSNYKAPVILGLVLLFFAALWAVGGKKGLLSVLGIIFTFACIVYLFIPMIYRGYSPILAAVLIVILATFVTLVLLNGWSSKTWSAIVGTMIGVTVAGLIAYIAGNMAHITGYNIDSGESLVTISHNTGLQLKDLLFAGILLASLGAMMDVSISIAAAVHEVYLASPNIGKKALYLAGLNVGRDMMGTMASTLILAFTGSALSSLIIIYALRTSIAQMLNMNLIGIEVILGMSGCIGIVLLVPAVAFVSSRIIPKYEKLPAAVTPGAEKLQVSGQL
ncbi:YibE/F family protein [Paenibacillus sp. MWE-103]|uniref:YibE/F family protein n=1 Tax=Paenibacillus artemisiicola TaxID=1172618 RepID=A0ABS3W9Q9_9BACL|nr:YibE/F family protein [Paenibacillus artemisiicola]MBO7745054.1 YibE/F family protein [Paenibacillus artemisiicola]